MSNALTVVCIVMIICFIIRMPLSFSMLTASAVWFLLVMPKGLGQIFTIITVDVFSGKMMPAALLFIFMTNILCESSFGASFPMKGSADKEVLEIGLKKVTQLNKEGYNRGFCCVVTAAWAAVGSLFPPSVLMVLYAMLTGVSLGNLFMASLVAGTALAAVIMSCIGFLSPKRDRLKGSVMRKERIIQFLPALLSGVLFLICIYTGVCSPAQAGAAASAFALLIGLLTHRSFGIRKLIRVISKTAVSAAALAFLTGTCGLFSWILAKEQIARTVFYAVTGLTDNRFVFLLIVNIVLLLLGCIMDGRVLLLILVPVLLPLIGTYGINPVHFGVMLCIDMAIAMFVALAGKLLRMTGDQ